MRQVWIVLGTAISLTSSPTTAATQDCAPAEQALSQISNSFSGEQKAIEDESRSIQGDTSKTKVSASIDIKMVEQRWVFNLPTVTLRTKQMSFDWPSTTMRNQEISWDMVTTVMRDRKVGQTPETTCEGGGKWDDPLPHCTTRWKDIIISVPETEIRRESLTTAVPEIKMQRIDFTTTVPEFDLREQTWFVKVPELTVRDVTVEAQKLSDRGKKLQRRSSDLAANYKLEAISRGSAVYSCHINNLTEQRSQAVSQFDPAISSLEGAITSISQAGGNPASVPDGKGGTSDLTALQSSLVSSKAEAIKRFDDAIDELLRKQKELANSI